MRSPDINVLLYAVNADAPQHAIARRWLEGAFNDSAGIGFSWIVLLGFLRLTTHPSVLPKPMGIEEALQFVDEWLQHPRAKILAPASNHAALLGRLLLGAGRGGNLTSDAHLAVIVIAHGATLGTFDRDFERFSGLHSEILTDRAVHET